MFGGSSKYAARAPVRALASAAASLTFAVNASAPLRTKRCSRVASRPTTRTFSPFDSREVAITEPVWPVAPKTTYMASPRFSSRAARDQICRTVAHKLYRSGYEQRMADDL